MSRSIRITAGGEAVDATLNDSDTAAAVLEALPISATASLWGEEIYFPIPVTHGEAEDAREVMAVGEIAYWPRGQALCIFLGRTPASQGDEPRAISPVNLIGRLEPGGAQRLLATVRQGDTITVGRWPGGGA